MSRVHKEGCEGEMPGMHVATIGDPPFVTHLVESCTNQCTAISQASHQTFCIGCVPSVIECPNHYAVRGADRTLCRPGTCPSCAIASIATLTSELSSHTASLIQSEAFKRRGGRDNKTSPSSVLFPSPYSSHSKPVNFIHLLSPSSFNFNS
jgi:hypothetical protein